MKKQNSNRLFFLTLILCFTYLSNAQTEIYGSWTAHCLLEKNNISSMTVCGLCPRVPIDDASLSIKSMDIIIDEKIIKVGDYEAVPYTWDEGNYSLTFSLSTTNHNYKVLVGGQPNICIWKGSDEVCIIVLQRK